MFSFFYNLRTQCELCNLNKNTSPRMEATNAETMKFNQYILSICTKWNIANATVLFTKQMFNQINFHLFDRPLNILGAIICLCALLNFNEKLYWLFFYHRYQKRKKCVHFNFVFLQVLLLSRLSIECVHWTLTHCRIT